MVVLNVFCFKCHKIIGEKLLVNVVFVDLKTAVMFLKLYHKVNFGQTALIVFCQVKLQLRMNSTQTNC